MANNESNKKNNAKKYLAIFFLFDLVVALIFLVFLGIQKCSGPQVNNSSSQIYNYDNNKIDDVFKKIVKNQLDVDGFNDDSLTDVVSVTYSDTSSSFNLNLVVRSESKVYYYQLSNYPYSGYDNFVPYLLSLDLDTKLSLNEGAISIDTYLPTLETITTDKQCKYLISTGISGTNKYFDGFYYQNNQYYVYQHQILDNDNPLNKDPNQVIGLDSPLYGYYGIIYEGGYVLWDGFVVLSEIATFCYKVDELYHLEDEGGLMWNDPDIGIDWPYKE